MAGFVGLKKSSRFGGRNNELLFDGFFSFAVVRQSIELLNKGYYSSFIVSVTDIFRIRFDGV